MIISHVASIVSGLLLLTIGACKPSLSNENFVEQSVRHTINVKLGKETQLSNNPSATYVLIQQKDDVKTVGAKRKFIVLRISDSVIVHEDQLIRGNVKWKDDSTLEKFSFPGKVKPDDDPAGYKTLISIDLPTLKQ